MRKLALVLLGLSSLPAMAQSSDKRLKLSGSVRARYEALGGQSRAGFGDEDDLFAFRTILSAEYDAHPIRIGAELYDSRAYGSDPGSAISTNDVNALELVQAYVAADLGPLFSKGSKVSVQLGRMMINLGSRRLVAADDYRNTTNGYTGIRVDAKTAGGTTATLIYTLPQVRLPDDPDGIIANRVQVDRESFDLQLWGGIVSRPRMIGQVMAEMSYLRLAERDAPGRPTRDRNLHNLSLRLIRDPAPSKVDGEVEFIYQFGTISSALGATASTLNVSARFLHADLGYSFAGPLTARLSVEYDYASGDGPGVRYGRFDTLFGMRRGDLAPAGIYSQIGRANISTPGLRLEVNPTARLDGFLSYRAMWLAERTDAFSTSGVRDASGRSGSFAGHQIDGRARLWLIPKRLRAEVNGTYVAKGRFLRDAPNAPATGSTRYVSAALSVFF